MNSIDNRCLSPNFLLTSFRTASMGIGTEVNKRIILVDLIKELLSNQINLKKHKKRKKNFNLAVKYIHDFRNLEQTPYLSIKKINTLAGHLYQLHHSLSLDRLPIAERPLMAHQQRKLAIALMAEERERFQLPLDVLQSTPESATGADRYHSQMALFSYLNSNQGKLIVREMSKKMNENEKTVFIQSIKHLRDLSKNYLATLSFIEAVKNSISRTKESSEEFWNIVEDQLFQMICKQVKSSQDVLLPMGWSCPQVKLGHHLLFFVENESNRNRVVMSIFDTAINNKLDQPIISDIGKERNSPIFNSISTSAAAPILEKPHTFISRKCNEKYMTHNFSKKIRSLARILMLQIPSFTQKYLETCTHRNGFIDSEFCQAILSQIVLEPLSDTEPLSGDEASPLTNWKWFPSPSCALASFQPLLQILALKKAELNQIELNEKEATNLKLFFELLQLSHKLFLLNNFFVGMEADVETFKEAIHQSIAECESQLIFN